MLHIKINVEVEVPLKQGLKLNSRLEMYRIFFVIVEVEVPLKQGLKLSHVFILLSLR